MTTVLLALGLGFGFGFVLHKAGLTQAARIVGIYRLRDLTVLRFMLTALAIAAVAIQAGLDLGLAAAVPVPPTRVAANLIGGVVFGVGMATAGFCPGTIVAQAGEGRLDAAIGGVAGLLAGALAYGLLQPLVTPTLAAVGRLGRVTVAGLTGASPWLVLVVFVEVVVLVLALASGRRPGSGRTPAARP